MSTAVPARKKVGLALQGGGAHGAFTWGVLDEIVADGRLEIAAFTGASAGAMNAVAFIDGWMDGDGKGARAQLERFWRSVAYDGGWSDAQRRVIGGVFGQWGLGSTVVDFWRNWLGAHGTPYDFNPLDINPLRDVLEKEIDFARMRANDAFKLFVSATNVETGKIRIFTREEITADHVMASACLPTLFRAVEIDGSAYWDGGYMGNPALYPLFYGTGCDDIILVQINPVVRKGIPRTRAEIENRLNEITFNATLLREFRAVEFVARLVDQGILPRDRYKRIRMHRIDSGDLFLAGSVGSKTNSGWDRLRRLRDRGRSAARRWLAAHFDAIGNRETLDLKAEIA